MEDMPFIMVSILLTLIIETIYAIIVGIFGLVIGHRNNNNRMVLSVIIGIVTYFVLQSLPVVAIFIAGLFDKNLMGLFSDSTDVAPSMSILRSLLIISNVSYIAIIIALYFSSKKLFNRGFDVE